MENKTHLRKLSLIDQERYQALEVPTSEMAHVGRERGNIPTKQQQGKA
jgi:hypothetical protein